jgi:hypothetical protein
VEQEGDFSGRCLGPRAARRAAWPSLTVVANYVCSIVIPHLHLQVAKPCVFDEYGGRDAMLKPTMSSQ